MATTTDGAPAPASSDSTVLVDADVTANTSDAIIVDGDNVGSTADDDNKNDVLMHDEKEKEKEQEQELKEGQTTEAQAQTPTPGSDSTDAAQAQAQASEMADVTANVAVTVNANDDCSNNDDDDAKEEHAHEHDEEATYGATATTSEAAAARLASEEFVHAAVLADLESSYVTLQQEHLALQLSCDQTSTHVSTQATKIQDLEIQLQGHTEALSHEKLESNSYKAKQLEATQETQLHKERLTRMIMEQDSLRDELARCTSQNSVLQKSLHTLETESKLSTSSAVPLRLELERSQVETEAVTAHSKWLQDELAAKTTELSEVQTRHQKEMSQYRLQAMSALNETGVLQSRVTCLERDQERSTHALDGSETALAQAKRDHALELQRHEEELQAEQHLVRLQTSHAQKLEERAQSLGRQMENLQQLASEAETLHAKQQAEGQIQTETALSELQTEHHTSVSKMQHELEASRKDNMELQRELQLVDQRRQRSLRRSAAGANAAGDSVALIEGEPASGGNELIPFPGNNANTTSTNTHPSFTDLLDRLTFAEEELMEERAERKRIELLFKKTQLDIEAKMPVIRAQRREYQQAMRLQEEARTESQTAQRQVVTLQSHLKEMTAQSFLDQKERTAWQKDLQALAQQVQTLLHHRAVGDHGDGDDNVSFSSIAQLQTRNQELIQSQTRLQLQMEELQEESNHGVLKRGLHTAHEELLELKQEREHQMTLVAGIVQQRDMYRVLLSQHDATFVGAGASDGGSGGTMVTAAAAATALSPTKSSLLQRELQEASGNLSATKAQLLHAKSENQGLDERCQRLDTLRQELTASLQSKQTEHLELVSAKTQSDASEQFWHQKCTRLEEHLTALQSEISALQTSRQDMQHTTTGLEQSLQDAQTLAATQVAEQRQGQALVRRLEAQVELSRQSEARLAAQAEAARTDLSRQGALLDSVQRIEAGLSARTAQELESLKEELTASKKELLTQKQAHASTLEHQTHQMEDGQLRYSNALQEKQDAVRHLLEAQKTSAESHTKVLQLESQVTSLETSCAELTTSLDTAHTKVTALESSSTNKAKDETIQSLTSQLHDAKSDLVQVRERLVTYQTIAKEQERNATELATSTKVLEVTHQTALAKVTHALAKTTNEAEAKQVALTELGDELATQRTLQNAELETLRTQVATLTTKLEAAQTACHTASEQLSSLQTEIACHKADATNATTNYERELALHSDARGQLGRLRTELDLNAKALANAEAQLESMTQNVSDTKVSHEKETNILRDTVQQAEQRVKEVSQQNELLHNQVSTLAATVEQRMTQGNNTKPLIAAAADEGDVGAAIAAEGGSSGEAATAELRGTVSELRQVIQFMRSERTVLDGQMESLKRSVARESSAAVVARQSLDAARVELKLLHHQVQQLQGQGGSTSAFMNDDAPQDKEEKKKLAHVEEQLTLTRESNQLLREETAKLHTQLQQQQKESAVAKSSAEPLHTKIRALETKQASLEAQRASLEREAEAWKGRVQSLVSKFHPVSERGNTYYTILWFGWMHRLMNLISIFSHVVGNGHLPSCADQRILPIPSPVIIVLL
jgi:nucleoprotein TPR